MAIGAERSRAKKQLDEARKSFEEMDKTRSAEAEAAEERWKQERYNILHLFDVTRVRQQLPAGAEAHNDAKTGTHTDVL